MNEVIKAITERYTCRDFTPTPLTDEQVKTLTDAALAAPSGGNRQPWQVVVITDKALIEELDGEAYKVLAGLDDKMYYERVKERGGRVFYDAPYLMVILGDGSTWSSLDSGILCQNVVLAAQSLGLGSCIVGLAGMAINGPRKEEYRKRLKFPEGYEFAIGVLVGTVKSGKEPHEWETSKVTYI
jgi:nitroreductase